jgi:hypothetical protein
MPRTPHHLPNEQSIDEGSAIVRALPSDGVAAAVYTRHQDRIVTDVPGEEPAFGNEIGRDASRKVRPRGALGLIAHT